jgi:hypothetical protein
MKTIKYIILIVMLGGFTSCAEKDLITFSDEDRLLFTGDAIDILYTFVYEKPSVIRDTIYLDVETIGNLSKTDRKIKLEQIIEEDKDNTAVPGTHYIAFDDTELTKHFIIKANAVRARIPIVLLRHASLQQNAIRLKLKIIENESFKHGEEKTFERLIIFSDKLEKPSKWDYNNWFDSYTLTFKEFFGEYGRKKHRFMIDVSGSKVDDEFIESVLFTGRELDRQKTYYFVGLFNQALFKYNMEHPNDPLREDPKEGQTQGDLVKFY